MRIINLVEDTACGNGCFHEHGLSFYIETERHRLLMDTGATDMFLRNAGILGVDVTQADTVILSHGHYDHAGGIPAFARKNPDARIYLRDSAGEDYYHVTADSERYIGIDKEILKLPQVVKVTGNLKIDEEMFLFTDVTGSRYPAKGNLELKKKTGGAFTQDTFDHEQCLVIIQDNRHILLSGCAHNGILNILDRYREIYHAWPDFVISGFHMVKKGEYTPQEIADIKDTAHALLKTGAVFYTGHCTGQPAFAIMKEIMGERLQILHSGIELKLC